MHIIFIILLIAVFAALGLAYLMKPNQDTIRKQRFKPFEHHPVANKGLFNERADIPENTMKAFRDAVKCGFGVVINVRLTKDKQVICTNYDNMQALCKVNLPVSSTDYEEIKSYKIKESSQSIPLLKDVLEEIGGTVPVIISIPEAIGDVDGICSKVGAVIGSYQGSIAVMSEYAPCVLWFRAHMPDVLRGQIGKNYFDPRNSSATLDLKEKLEKTFMLNNYKSMPDFIAYDFMDFDAPAMKVMRSIFGVETLGYGMNSQKCIDDLKVKFDICVFEGFTPKEVENVLY